MVNGSINIHKIVIINKKYHYFSEQIKNISDEERALSLVVGLHRMEHWKRSRSSSTNCYKY